jgi:acyl-coenzyme A synthetase/AMP-(fatty) acid ligase
MFVRLLKLAPALRMRNDLSSLRTVIHAAAPCPVAIKRGMMEWLGPIVHEYYGGSEGNGGTRIGPEEWLARPGSVGKASWGTLHICDDAGHELPAGKQGIVYFEGGWDFKYLGDDAKTRDSRNPLHPAWSTLGDVGYVDADGYLFLTDRKSYMIITGGVNVYPQEVENLLITHPRVADAAVLGVPNPDFGEEVKAVVQPLDPADATSDFAAELIAFCKANLSPVKCPRSVDFDPALPRLDNGKLYKRLIKDRYWSQQS